MRPAYLNRINFNIGGDSTVIGQQTLKGSHMVMLDTPTNATVKLAYEQLSLADHVHAGFGRRTT